MFDSGISLGNRHVTSFVKNLVLDAAHLMQLPDVFELLLARRILSPIAIAAREVVEIILVPLADVVGLK